MWGILHLNSNGGRLAGWLCDSWTEAGASASEVLLPRLCWLSKEDDKFYLAYLNIPFVGNSKLELGDVDKDIEPRREAFMRAALAEWENEYFTTQGVQVT